MKKEQYIPSTKETFIEKKENILFESVGQYIEVGENPPRLISIIGPNRSGTTALAEVFARMGITNYLQPIKSIRRAIEEKDGNIPYFRIDQVDPIAVHKETLGSSQDSEFFNPVELLLSAGYPKEKIHLIAILRHPDMILTSWNRMYGGNANIKGLIKAIEMTDNIADFAHKIGINVIYHVHEAIRDNDPRDVIRALLCAINLQESEQDIENLIDWSFGPIFGSEQSTGVFYDSPPDIFVEGVKTRGGYKYNHQVANYTKQQKDVLDASNALRIYESFREKMRLGLGIK